MTEDVIALAKLLRKDSRFPLDAYFFVREALSFASDQLALDEETRCNSSEASLSMFDLNSPPGEIHSDDPDDTTPFSESDESDSIISHRPSKKSASRKERHVTGQQLCDGIRRYALSQFGFMSKTVLHSWGIYNTGDFGEIVFNLIHVGIMKKSAHDRRSHFDNVYDFDDVFERQFEISCVAPLRLS